MKRKVFLGLLVMVLAFALVFVSCTDEKNNIPPPPPEEPVVDNIGGDVWLKTKESKYNIEDGKAGEIKSEAVTEWLIYKYVSATNYEQKFKLTESYGESTTHIIRDGQNEERTVNYVIGEYEGEMKQKNVYDLDSGLTSKSINMNTDVETEHTIELLSDAGGIKTYKHITSTYFTYEYKIKDGRIIEEKLYSDGTLSYTITYAFPENEVIRTKLPDFTLQTQTHGDSGIYGDKYQEVEVISDNNSALTIRLKTYSKSIYGMNPQFELYEINDIRYEKFSYPFP